MDTYDSLAEALADGKCPVCRDSYLGFEFVEAFDGPEPEECEWCVWMRATHYRRTGEKPRVHRVIIARTPTRKEIEAGARLPDIYELEMKPVKRPGTTGEEAER
jgi:hypothetical protein